MEVIMKYWLGYKDVYNSLTIKATRCKKQVYNRVWKMLKFIVYLLLVVTGSKINIQKYEQSGLDTHGKESENYNTVSKNVNAS